MKLSLRALAPVALTVLVAGCGLQVEAPDLFLLTRTGGGKRVTLLVNSGGTIRCNGSAAKPLPDNLLLEARDLASGTLNTDAENHMHIPQAHDSVYMYRVKLQPGTITFPDTAASKHHELAELELLALKILQGPCQGLSHSG